MTNLTLVVTKIIKGFVFEDLNNESTIKTKQN